MALPTPINNLLPGAISMAGELYRELHSYPELSMHEHETSRRVSAALQRMGIPFEKLGNTTGVIAIIEGGKQGKTIGLRAELDALPIDERSGLPYSSRNSGVMHACGHDFHMANLLAAASILSALKEEICGRILLIFQPSEELLPGGALSVMQSGAFTSNLPDTMLGLHVLPELETGKVGFRPGSYMASGDELYFSVKGKGGHGALRQSIIDPVLMASKLVVALQSIPADGEVRGIPTVLSIGKFIAPGATNVIPDSVELQGTFRTMNEDWRSEAHRLIAAKAAQISTETGGTIEVNIIKGYPSVFNNYELTQKCSNAAIQLLGKQRVVDLPIRMTTDDFAYYSLAIPSVYFRVGVAGERSLGGLHSNTFIPDIRAFETSVPLTVWLVLELAR